MTATTIAAIVVTAVVVVLLLKGRDRQRRIGGGPDRPPAPTPPRGDVPGIGQQPALANLSESEISEIEREIASGKKISAIKLVREKAGIGLKEAKQLVEDIAAGGRR